MYVERIVLFVDILGFKELSENELGFESVSRVYDRFNNMIENANQRFISQINSFSHVISKKDETGLNNLTNIFKSKDAEILFFSDCVVWTYRIDRLPKNVQFWNVLLALCGSLQVLQATLFNDKILIRGGVSIGGLFIENYKVYGPALVKAYELESTTRYPRIALDREIFEKRIEQKFKPFFKNRIIEYDTGKYAFDYFEPIKSFIEVGKKNSQLGEVFELAIKTFVEPVEITILNGINHPDSRVRNKYEWLISQLLSISNLDKYYDTSKIKSIIPGTTR